MAAGEFVQTGLFSELSTFDQLEDRIAAFTEDWKRGAAFEVFAEAYLVTQRQHDATKVWPFRAVPIELLQRLSLLGQDYGIDGVFETTLGHYNAYSKYGLLSILPRAVTGTTPALTYQHAV